MLVQEFRTHVIANALIVRVMRRSIELNAQSLGGTIKVHDERTVAVLTPELPAIELTALKITPQKQFSGC